MGRSKSILFIVLLISIMITIGCNYDDNNYNLSNELMLEQAQYWGIHHLQSPKEIEILKKNKIKTLSVVEEDIEKGSLDSLTYIRFNDLGYITSKTTDECTTVGCLPYTIVQVFKYDNGRIIKMEDYTFKKKYKTKQQYWQMQDTSKLSLFDWEDYTYSGDTLRIESGSQKWTLLKDTSGQIISNRLIIKTNKQTILSHFEYQSDSTTSITTYSNSSAKYSMVYKILDGNKVERTGSNSLGKNIKSVYVFNEIGLIDEIQSYKDDELKGRLKFNYSKEI